MNILAHSTGFVIYDGDSVSNNPSKQYANWKRTEFNVSVEKPSGPTKLELLPNSTNSIFNGVVPTSIDGTTALTLSLNPVKSRSLQTD